MKEYSVGYTKIPRKNASSRYYFTPYIKDSSGIVLTDLYKPPVYNDTDTYIYHNVSELERNRIDIVALKYYEDPTYWWIIAVANQLINPFIITPGTVLKVPTKLSYYLKGNKQ